MNISSRPLWIALGCLLIASISSAATTIIRPTANVIPLSFTAVGDTTNYLTIDEVSKDDDTTYNTRSDGTTTREYFTGPDQGALGTISGVVLTCFARDLGTGSQLFSLYVTHDAEYGCTGNGLGTTYSQFDCDVTANETWEEGDFSGAGKIKFGYASGGSGTKERRVTQCYLTITNETTTTTTTSATTTTTMGTYRTKFIIE